MNVFESTKEMAEKKLAKLDKFFDESAEMTVSFSHRHGLEMVEITVRTGSLVFRGEEGSDSFASSVDRAVEALERQIRKNKTRLEKQIRSDGIRIADEDFGDVEEEPEFRIRKKSFPVRPMSPEEAILQMNLVDHNFFIFEDESTGDICVVYKRKDDTYGLITPLHE
jgi:putative sigma-54 modulation protein